jgi:hypothetical protein
MTEEQKARRELMKGLIKRLAAMHPDEKAAFMAKLPCVVTLAGRSLSPTNTVLCYYQGLRDDKIVGGVAQWRAVGRQIIEGSAGYSIWIPFIRKDKEAKEGDEGDEKTGFFLGTVYDLSQTVESASKLVAA